MKLTKQYIASIINEYESNRDDSNKTSQDNINFINSLKSFYDTLVAANDSYELSYNDINNLLDATFFELERESSFAYKIQKKLLNAAQSHVAEMSEVEVSTLDKFFVNSARAKTLLSSVEYLKKFNLIGLNKENLKILFTLVDDISKVCNALWYFSRKKLLDQPIFDYICRNAAVITPLYKGHNILTVIIRKLKEDSIYRTLDNTSKGTSLNKVAEDLAAKEKLLWENPAHADKLAAAFIFLALCKLSPHIKEQFYVAFSKYPEVSHLLALSLRSLYALHIEEQVRLNQLIDNIQNIPLITYTLINLFSQLENLIENSKQEILNDQLNKIFLNSNTLLQYIDASIIGSVTKHKHKDVIADIVDLEKLCFYDTDLFSIFEKHYISDVQSILKVNKIFKILLILSIKETDTGENLLNILPVELLSRIALTSYADHISYQALANNLKSMYKQAKAKNSNVQPESKKPQTEFFKLKKEETETRLASEPASPQAEAKDLSEEQTTGINLKK